MSEENRNSRLNTIARWLLAAILVAMLILSVRDWALRTFPPGPSEEEIRRKDEQRRRMEEALRILPGSDTRPGASTAPSE